MSSMTTPHVVEDFLGVLKLYSDGSIVREPIERKIPIHDDGSAVWKDCLFHQRHNLQLRLYKPASSTHSSDGKLPIVYYIHAGGFCFGSRSHPNSHNSCLSLASGLRALVVAPDLRLAPEHRVPAAIDDAHGALTWLKAQALSGTSRDLWLCDDEVDFDRVFLLGDSSGGNVAHHLAVRLGPGSLELAPVRVRGYVLLSPFFGGTVPTVSELERPCEEFWNSDMYDRLWRLSLPGGATKDHPISNPLGLATSSLKDVGLDPILVVVGGDEILRDRAEDYVRGLKELGKEVSYVEFQGKQHGFFTSKSFSEEAKEVIQVFKDFIFKNSS